MTGIAMTPSSRTEDFALSTGNLAGFGSVLRPEDLYRPFGYRREALAPDTAGS